MQVEALARSVLRDPLHIVVGERNSAQSLVLQRLMFVGREAGKLLALRQLITGGGLKPPVLVRRGNDLALSASWSPVRVLYLL